MCPKYLILRAFPLVPFPEVITPMAVPLGALSVPSMKLTSTHGSTRHSRLNAPPWVGNKEIGHSPHLAFIESETCTVGGRLWPL